MTVHNTHNMSIRKVNVRIYVRLRLRVSGDICNFF